MTELATPDDRLSALALAIIERNDRLAATLIEEGVPLTGKRLTLSPPPGVPARWFEEGLPPLTWVVTQMVDLVRGQDNGEALPSSFAAMAAQFGMPTQSRGKSYPEEMEKTLEALSLIGGSLLLAGASAEVRLGRTARSQKALDALAVYLPEYATSMRAAAHQRLLRGLVKKKRPDPEPEEKYNRRM